jgi:hypothetical protein
MKLQCYVINECLRAAGTFLFLSHSKCDSDDEVWTVYAEIQIIHDSSRVIGGAYERLNKVHNMQYSGCCIPPSIIIVKVKGEVALLS